MNFCSTKQTVAMLMTGDELMSGDTVDSNSAFMAQMLAERGIPVAEKVTLGDDPERLSETITRLTKAHGVLLMNGGLGPTEDDLTAQIVAELMGSALIEHPEAKAHVINWCERRRIVPNAANLKQALLPDGADLIANPLGSASGFAVTLNDCVVMTTPGVPSEARAMMPDILARTERVVGSQRRHTLRLQTFGIGESTIQEMLKTTGSPWPDSVRLGFRAGMPQLELKLIVDDESALADQSNCKATLETLFGDHILGTDDTTLALALKEALLAEGKTVTTAESCTGGLIASMITREPGSSAVFEAGYVTYSNAVKHALLDVSNDTLKAHGAVSEPVVKQMLMGALARSGADVGVAVSGVAGPDGGTPEKPVGTVWMAWGDTAVQRTRKLNIPGSRRLIQDLVAGAALDLLRRHLLGLPPEPHYFTRQAQ